MIKVTTDDPIEGTETKRYSTLDAVFNAGVLLGLLAACLPKHGTITIYNADEPSCTTIERS